MTLAALIAEYHERIAAPGMFEAMWDALDHPYLRYRDTPVLGVLRPVFVTRATYGETAEAARLVQAALRKIVQWSAGDPTLRRELALDAGEEAVAALADRLPVPDVHGRFDGFLGSDGVVRFVEYNADSPAGIAQGQLLTERFVRSPVLRALGARYRFETQQPAERAIAALLDAYRAWGGREAVPSIAISDLAGVGTFRDFFAFRDLLAARGHRVAIASVDQLALRDGRLWAGDLAADIVFKRALVADLLAAREAARPLCDAVRTGAACVINGLGAEVLNKKVLFALLTDPRLEQRFSRAERAAIARHVPWTRRLRDERTPYRGRLWDLLDLVATHREAFVIKPSTSCGGDGVVLGAESTPDAWAAAIARRDERALIVQERVELPRELVPVRAGERLAFEERYADLCPYVWSGSTCDGAGVRFSASPILNIAGGGSIGALIVVAEEVS